MKRVSDRRGRRLPWLAAATLGVALACAADSGPQRREIVLATTTSTEDSGLLEVLIPAFEAARPSLRVRVLAVGSGEALAFGRRADADVLLVHAPSAEAAFMDGGFGTRRLPVMHNDFVIAGPPEDPAGVRGLEDAAEALRRIAAARALFVSRGDDSGTHQRERALWAEAGMEPGGPWYLDAGQGMGEVLRIASERGAYTLSDRSTYLFLRESLRLETLVEGDRGLKNPYSVIQVAGARNAAGARALADWITGPEGRAVIGAYGVERFGRPLFVPDPGGR